jgi:hypothetical protein
VPTIELDERTTELVRFAARMFDVSESEVVARALREFTRLHEQHAKPPQDPWAPVPVYAEYEGHRVEATYLPATRRLVVTGEPLAGQRFKSPSGAARAVVAALNPGRAAATTNGWRFWHVTETGERLQSLR